MLLRITSRSTGRFIAEIEIEDGKVTVTGSRWYDSIVGEDWIRSPEDGQAYYDLVKAYFARSTMMRVEEFE